MVNGNSHQGEGTYGTRDRDRGRRRWHLRRLSDAARAQASAGIVLLPEVFNTNEHIRSVADGYASDGFAVLAPDVYWRQEAGNYLPYTDEGRAKAQALRAELDTDQFARDLGDAVAALKARPDCTDKVGVMGFCLGGKFAYLSGTRHPIDAAVSYYGVQIDQHLDEADALGCPILMHFAENDPHVPPETVTAIGERMGAWANVAIEVYPGTEHGFNRYGYPPHNEAQAAIARARTLDHFRRFLS
ncbi:MAG: dienelactone hydrolase family protein [Alphaproteobacteria bacterium]|nr:dienelactone hydrolase family protein [Alphaproteobacteria bacterium]